jgi:4-amino-4-deoxy-L-arabinose transferase-like glycosyltransferase
MIFYTAEHLDPMPPRRLLLGFIVDIGAATFATLLLIVALPSLPKYWGRVVFVAALGVFAIFAVRMVDGVFHNLPIRWTVNLTLDTAISWVLTGLVLAAIVRPSKDSA